LLVVALYGKFNKVTSLVSSQLSATDANVQKSGSCVADVPIDVARLLHSRSESKGERVRLDWTETELTWAPTKMMEPDKSVDELVASLSWQSGRAHHFAKASHINIQEVLACAEELDIRGLGGERDKRIVCLLDSRVAIGSISKGRSSSRSLNRAVSRFW
jgi:hypothetical protein